MPTADLKLMEWSPHFETGIAAVDTQHRGLVDIINAAIPRLADPDAAGIAEIGALMDKLADYAERHFSSEEALMASRGIDAGYLAAHRAGHEAFVREIGAMQKELATGGAELASRLLRFVVGWLSFHILTEDQHMARQLDAIGRGVPAQTARETTGAVVSPAVAVLVDAMESLLSLLNERNRELAAANATLEGRVARRTAELERERDALKEANSRIEETRESLLQSEKMAAVGQLAAGVAHEINNPIGFVMSNLGSLKSYTGQLFDLAAAAEALVARLPPDHPDRAAWRAAREAAELDFLRDDIPDLLRESGDGLARVKRIVADLKDFSHVDEGEWTAVDLNGILASTLNIVWNELKYKAEVVREFGELPQVTCIPAQLGQVFMNLLVNAAHAIEDRGRITLRSGAVVGDDGPGTVWVEIEDTGKGMTPEVKRRIFEPFFTTKPVGKGTGLGLSIAWDIVERHRGQIEVDSTPGRGTRFRLTVPAQRAAADEAAG